MGVGTDITFTGADIISVGISHARRQDFFQEEAPRNFAHKLLCKPFRSFFIESLPVFRI
jgi:hypothetical protein